MWKKLYLPSNLLRYNTIKKNVLKKKIHSCASLRSLQGTLSQSERGSQNIVKSQFSDVVIPTGVSYTQFLFDQQEKYGDNIAFINGETGEEFTHRDVREKSLTLSSAFSRLGYSKGDVIAVMSPNCPQMPIVYMGLMNVGIIPSPISSSFTSEEVKYQINHADCSAVVCHEDKLNVVREAVKDCANIRHIISFGPEEDGVLSLRKLFKDDGKGIPNVQINEEEDLAIIPFSSGTTGLPKGVMLTHKNLTVNILQTTAGQGSFHIQETTRDYQDALIGLLPMYHIYGIFINIAVCMHLGCKVVTLKEFNKHSFIKCVDQYKPSVLPLVPPIIQFLENSKLVKPHLLDSVHSIFSGAAPLGQAVLDNFVSKFGDKIEITEGYGLTESSPLINISPKGRYKFGACGTPVANTLTKLIDSQTGEMVDPYKNEGELCVKGPQIMKGYLKNEAETKKTIIDGWLHTGDVARIDEDKFVYIVDRIKELIKVKGLQVAPAELENLLRTHPGVDDVAVIGIPDERAGEVPKAFIVPSNDYKGINEEEIKQFIAKQVAPHKRLAVVSFIDEIPKSAAGKILRKDLRKIQ